jgi:hypothetical protein
MKCRTRKKNAENRMGIENGNWNDQGDIPE